MSHDDHDPLSGLRPAPPPEELAGRVLRAARDALEPGRTVWDRLWESRAARVAWGTVTVLLFATHLALSVLPGRGPGSESETFRTHSDEPGLREILSLPPVGRVARLPDEPAEDSGPGAVPSKDGDRS